MVIMSCNIGFDFILNKTCFEWHELQHHVKDWVANQHLHCIPTSFKKDPTFTATVESDFESDRDYIEFHVRLNVVALSIEIVAI